MLPGSIPLLGGAKEWSPLDLGPVAMFDASELSSLYQTTDTSTPVTTHGQSVGRWEDLSGNGRHVTQATASNRPNYNDSGGLQYITCDGTDVLRSGTFTQPGQMTACVAMYSTNLAGTKNIINADGGAGSPRGHQYIRTSGSTPQVICFTTVNGNATDNGNTISTSTNYTLISDYDGSNIEMFVNNASSGSTNLSGTPGTASEELEVCGSTGGGVGGKFIGRIYAAILFDFVLSSDERSQVHDWLNSRMGI